MEAMRVIVFIVAAAVVTDALSYEDNDGECFEGIGSLVNIINL